MPKFHPTPINQDCWSSIGNITFYHRNGQCFYKRKPYPQPSLRLVPELSHNIIVAVSNQSTRVGRDALGSFRFASLSSSILLIKLVFFVVSIVFLFLQIDIRFTHLLGVINEKDYLYCHIRNHHIVCLQSSEAE